MKEALTCIHLGRTVVSTIRRDGTPVSLFNCEKFKKHCTLSDEGFRFVKGDGSPFPVCATCQSFQAVVSEVEAAFAGIQWGSAETISGTGSSLANTLTVREKLPAMLRQLGANSLLDLPCGDLNWMQFVDLSGIEYIGGDVVREIVDANRTKFPDRRFEHLDLTAVKLPQADVVFVRDCLVHLPYRMIYQALKNVIASGAKWLIATHFPGRKNHEIPLGRWRPVDMTAKPIGLPEPHAIINEGCTEGDGAYADKSLGVWSVDAIREVVDKLSLGPLLTIGMATYRDWPGVWATIKSLQRHHAEVWNLLEIVVVDNDPQGDPNSMSELSHSGKAKRLCDAIAGRYEHFTVTHGTAAAKGRIFDLATAPAVLVIDCHVVFETGLIRKLIDWSEANQTSKDLWQGPCRDDTDGFIGTHFAPRWGGLMYGQWATDHEKLAAGEPFEVDMQGCGMFACRKAAWPGFHPLLKGFGPEEFHLHQRIRRNGGKCLCIPWLAWDHRFGNPEGSSPPGTEPEKRLRGNLITHLDTGEPSIDEIRHHFVEESKALTNEQFDAVLSRTVVEFWAGRADTGVECEHRKLYQRTGSCQIGCQLTSLPIFGCDQHGECAPWDFQQPHKRGVQVCLRCELNPMLAAAVLPPPQTGVVHPASAMPIQAAIGPSDELAFQSAVPSQSVLSAAH